ncbi:hypothetical protein KGQ71_04480 [Patescibacteria group bacterium]|nr:hypothetical protein [Patescibacteria group bacterium]
MKRLLIFASGSKDGGGSGFQELVENSRIGVITDAEIVAVVSNHADGGVRKRAERLGIPFIYFVPTGQAGEYTTLVKQQKADWVLLSGWLKKTTGLDPCRTINIHPGPLPEFGGPQMYGHRVHEAVINAFRAGKITESAVCMHFVTDEYDRGPVFFRYPVLIRPDDTAETLAERVNKIEHGWQSYVTNLVIHGKIHWDGRDPRSLRGTAL